MDNKVIVGIGEVLWDCLPEGKKAGGAPANFAYHISQLGYKAYIVSAVGNDSDGDEIVRFFNDKQLNCVFERTPYPTGTVQVTLDKHGVPQYVIQEEVAWDHLSFNAQLKHLAKEARAVCFGSLAQRSPTTRETIWQFLRAAAANPETLIIFDINLRENFYTKDIIVNSLNACNILKINDEELKIVAEMLGYHDVSQDEFCHQLVLRFQLQLLILTRGINGSRIFTEIMVDSHPIPKVQVADTVGAGDAFTAAFTVALLSGKSITVAHDFAVKVSSFVCKQEGAMNELPPYLRHRLQSTNASHGAEKG